jgi:GNAT superfamily N-acetyltransferase
MDAISISRRTPTDEEGILRLYTDTFGPSLAAGSRRRWTWQYRENPETRDSGDEPEIWVAREGDRILGQYASMPVVLWWQGRDVRASWGMDVFVRPEARGKGVGARLFLAWADHVDVALGLGLTPSSYALFHKLGFADVGPVPFFRTWLDPKAVMSRRLGTALGRIAGAVIGLALRLRQRRPRVGNVVVTPIKAFGPEYDDLWSRTRASHAMCVRRNSAYLNWKYVQCPHREYDLWEARQEGRLVGFAVSRHEDYRGLRLGWIVDVYADAADGEARGALLATILESFRTQGVARAQAFAMSQALARDLRGVGFVRGRSPMQFCVHARADSAEALRDLGRWHVVFGDSDMDR